MNGPVYLPKIYNGKNKTFFLFTEEHRTFPLAAGNSITGTTTLPTAAFDQGNFAALLDPGLDTADHGFFGRGEPPPERVPGAEAETEKLPTPPKDLHRESGPPGASSPDSGPPDPS